MTTLTDCERRAYSYRRVLFTRMLQLIKPRLLQKRMSACAYVFVNVWPNKAKHAAPALTFLVVCSRWHSGRRARARGEPYWYWE